MKIFAIVPAAGSGRRLNRRVNKPFIKLGSKPLLAHALEALNNSHYIDGIVLVVAEKSIEKTRNLVEKYRLSKVKFIVKGGKSRSDSVANGLKMIDKSVDYVLIHDGVRPFLEEGIIKKAVFKVKRYQAACVCVKPKQTVKSRNNGFIINTLKRDSLLEAQTPQVFKRDIILEAYRNKKLLGKVTDDASLVEELGYKVAVVPGSYRNIKITTEEDLLLAEALITKIQETRCKQ